MNTQEISVLLQMPTQTLLFDLIPKRKFFLFRAVCCEVQFNMKLKRIIGLHIRGM